MAEFYPEKYLLGYLGESEQINLPVNSVEKQISLSLKKTSGKLKTSDSLIHLRLGRLTTYFSSLLPKARMN